jgi:hypothetical protein
MQEIVRGTCREAHAAMSRIAAVALAAVAALAGCRGEPVPRDYQNNPPAATHPVTTSGETPTAHGMPGAAPEPSTGAEGRNVTGQPANPLPPTTTLKDQAPAGTTATSVTAPH